jgi:hypothetical protein
VIVSSLYRRSVGERRLGMTDHKIDYHPAQAFIIVREATRQEWLDQLHAMGEVESWTERDNPRPFYYEIQTD